jgi:CheY-like chemotaxis protein
MQPQPRRRLLIIEDDLDQAESLHLLLDIVGYEVRVAYDGPGGIRAAQEWPPNVVVCDIRLPGLNGYDVAAQFRRSPETAHTVLVAITAYADDGTDFGRRAREAGFDNHLLKPADPELILQLLATTPP